jgi:DNA-binding MarR family transcriptional regulator
MKKSDFEKQKNASLSHQLVKVGRLINERGLASAREAFHLPKLKQSHLDLFPYIDFEGTGISKIARRKGVSKQSVSKLVQEMVHMKILFLKADPEDSRSKRVFFKTSGPFDIQKGFEALMSIDRLLVDHFEEKTYTSVLKKVSDLVDIFQSESQN